MLDPATRFQFNWICGGNGVMTTFSGAAGAVAALQSQSSQWRLSPTAEFATLSIRTRVFVVAGPVTVHEYDPVLGCPRSKALPRFRWDKRDQAQCSRFHSGSAMSM